MHGARHCSPPEVQRIEPRGEKGKRARAPSLSLLLCVPSTCCPRRVRQRHGARREHTKAPGCCSFCCCCRRKQRQSWERGLERHVIETNSSFDARRSLLPRFGVCEVHAQGRGHIQQFDGAEGRRARYAEMRERERETGRESEGFLRGIFFRVFSSSPRFRRQARLEVLPVSATVNRNRIMSIGGVEGEIR